MTTTALSPEAQVVALSGNPRPHSRTSLVAAAVADQLIARFGWTDSVVPLELADVASELFGDSGEDADRFAVTLARAAVIVVATPVYKASYTGLLKAFVDRFPPGWLQHVVAIPVVVSTSPAHSFVAEHLLRPLLVELGAVVPVRGLAVIEKQLLDIDAVVQAWADTAAPTLSRVLDVRLDAP